MRSVKFKARAPIQDGKFLGTTFETRTRVEFIKACHILAKGLEPISRAKTMVGVEGHMEVAKSLVADAFLNALNDGAQKYNMPPSKKMTLEEHPAAAIYFAHRAIIGHQGQDIEFSFLRSMGQDASLFEPQLNVLSGDMILPQWVDMVISLKRSYYKPYWYRDWSVTVVSTELMTDAMETQLNHLRNFQSNRDRRLGL